MENTDERFMPIERAVAEALEVDINDPAAYAEIQRILGEVRRRVIRTTTTREWVALCEKRGYEVSLHPGIRPAIRRRLRDLRAIALRRLWALGVPV